VVIFLTNIARTGIAIGALKTALWNQEGSVTFNMQDEQFSGRCAASSHFHLLYNLANTSSSGIEVTVMQNASFRWAQLGDVTIAATGMGPGSIGGEALSFALRLLAQHAHH
jgi:hypothetical protein